MCCFFLKAYIFLPETIFTDTHRQHSTQSANERNKTMKRNMLMKRNGNTRSACASMEKWYLYQNVRIKKEKSFSIN